MDSCLKAVIVSKWSLQVCCESVNHCKNGEGPEELLYQNDEDAPRKFENYPLICSSECDKIFILMPSFLFLMSR